MPDDFTHQVENEELFPTFIPIEPHPLLDGTWPGLGDATEPAGIREMINYDE